VVGEDKPANSHCQLEPFAKSRCHKVDLNVISSLENWRTDMANFSLSQILDFALVVIDTPNSTACLKKNR
jgi:hypothetical protein